MPLRRRHVVVTSFARTMRKDRPSIGVWSNLADPVVTEICAGSGFDWILIDGEHAPNDIRTVLAQLQAVAAHRVVPVVRPAHGDAVAIKQHLDLGARNLLIPMVDSQAQAEMLARSVCFPPIGIRGVAGQTRGGQWGRDVSYLHTARDEITLIVQIETAAGLNEAEKIIAVNGVDAVFVGPADLSASLGHLGQPGHPDVRAAVTQVLDLAKAAGKPAGIMTLDEDLARDYCEQGFSFVAVGIDTDVLGRSLSALRGRFPDEA